VKRGECKILHISCAEWNAFQIVRNIRKSRVKGDETLNFKNNDFITENVVVRPHSALLMCAQVAVSAASGTTVITASRVISYDVQGNIGKESLQRQQPLLQKTFPIHHFAILSFLQSPQLKQLINLSKLNKAETFSELLLTRVFYY
jgi:hypothetical protein